MTSWRQLSPPGIAAVSVLAVKGDLSRLSLRDRRGRPIGWPAMGCFRVAILGQGTVILDEALIVGTADGAELHLHGGAGARDGVVRWLEATGFREVETHGLLTSHSLRHARALLSARHGPLARLRRWLDCQTKRRARMPAEVPHSVAQDLRRCRARLALARNLAKVPVVALAGKANAGKSSLFNALIGSDRALVASEAGTTRDTVRARIVVHGAVVELHDRAGGSSSVSPDGSVDLLIHVLTDQGEEPCSGATVPHVLRVLGKADLRSATEGPSVSGLTGEGTAALFEDIATALGLSASVAEDLWCPCDPLIAAAMGRLPSRPGHLDSRRP